MNRLFISVLGKRLTITDLFPNYGKTDTTTEPPLWHSAAMAIGMIALTIGVEMLTRNIEKYPEERR
jgi:hypothetical protein